MMYPKPKSKKRRQVPAKQTAECGDCGTRFSLDASQGTACPECGAKSGSKK